LGADIIKVERPGTGDDTRAWGPPWFTSPDGGKREASYFVSRNRGKRSIAIDMGDPNEAALIADMAAEADVFVENFKVGALTRYGLDHATLTQRNPRLIYCSISGFGQTGPYAELPGYDFIAQAMGGMMSLTGEPEGAAMKTGVALADIMTGLYACNGILAALFQRERSGRGQHVTTCLLDVQIATLANQALGYLATGQNPRRMGNAHPSIVPYQSFDTADGTVALAVGNDSQFRRSSPATDASKQTRPAFNIATS
jgi:crotonobetainyl-CoA:carnitine CoA-transferase CaiB-like acyl-CoA transferase